MPSLTEAKQLELVDEYLSDNDWTIHELSIIFKVSHRTVYRILAKYDAKRNKNDRIKRAGRHPNGQFAVKPKKRTPPKPKPEPQPCGTNAAYQRHRYKKEYPCSPCLEAHALNVKISKEKKK